MRGRGDGAPGGGDGDRWRRRILAIVVVLNSLLFSPPTAHATASPLDEVVRALEDIGVTITSEHAALERRLCRTPSRKMNDWIGWGGRGVFFVFITRALSHLGGQLWKAAVYGSVLYGLFIMPQQERDSFEGVFHRTLRGIGADRGSVLAKKSREFGRYLDNSIADLYRSNGRLFSFIVGCLLGNNLMQLVGL